MFSRPRLTSSGVASPDVLQRVPRFVHPRTAGSALLLLALLACGPGQSPAPGDSSNPGIGTEVVVTGTERLAWTQNGPDSEVPQYRYAAYVDDQRVELDRASCARDRGTTGQRCTSPLPSLSPGRHVIQLVSSVARNGATVESARSAPLHVNKVAGVTSGVRVLGSGDETTFSSGGLDYRLDVIARNLTAPVALAFTPDRRLLVAERGGTIRIYSHQAASGEVALAPADLHEDAVVVVHSLELHPAFARNRQVLLLYTAITESGRSCGSFASGKSTIVSASLPCYSTVCLRARAIPTGALSFGPDGKVYVATNDASLARGADQAGRSSGRLLRLNDDGTTPSDASPGSTAIAAGLERPVALGWNPVSARFWLFDQSAQQNAREVELTRGWMDVLNDPEVVDACLYRGPLGRESGIGLFQAKGTRLRWFRFSSTSLGQTNVEIELPASLGLPRVLRQGENGSLYIASDMSGGGNSGAGLIADSFLLQGHYGMPGPSSRLSGLKATFVANKRDSTPRSGAQRGLTRLLAASRGGAVLAPLGRVPSGARPDAASGCSRPSVQSRHQGSLHWSSR